MTPSQITRRRRELGLTLDEMAFALNMTENELRCIEEGLSERCRCAEFEEAFATLEERVFGLYVGA